MHNAFVLFTKIDPTWKKRVFYKRRTFIEKLGITLVTNHVAERKFLPRARATQELTVNMQNSGQPEL